MQKKKLVGLMIEREPSSLDQGLGFVQYIRYYIYTDGGCLSCTHIYIPNIFFKIKYIHTYLSRYRTCTYSTYMLLISISLIPTTRIYPCIDGWMDR